MSLIMNGIHGDKHLGVDIYAMVIIFLSLMVVVYFNIYNIEMWDFTISVLSFVIGIMVRHLYEQHKGIN